MYMNKTKLSFEEYFQEQISNWDNTNEVMLNPAKRSHREKFKEKLEEQLKIYNIEWELAIAQEKPTH